MGGGMTDLLELFISPFLSFSSWLALTPTHTLSISVSYPLFKPLCTQPIIYHLSFAKPVSWYSHFKKKPPLPIITEINESSAKNEKWKEKTSHTSPSAWKEKPSKRDENGESSLREVTRRERRFSSKGFRVYVYLSVGTFSPPMLEVFVHFSPKDKSKGDKRIKCSTYLKASISLTRIFRRKG